MRRIRQMWRCGPVGIDSIGAMTRNRLRLAGLMMTVGARRVSHALRLPLRMAAMRRASGPERLLIAPQDIRTSDPTIAADIYAGYFSFAGKSVAANGKSPFEIDAGSELWLRELAGFGWLRHLRAADTPLARANARALVAGFITASGKPSGKTVAWDVDVAARRLLSWLSQSPLILEGGDRPTRAGDAPLARPALRMTGPQHIDQPSRSAERRSVASQTAEPLPLAGGA